HPARPARPRRPPTSHDAPWCFSCAGNREREQGSSDSCTERKETAGAFAAERLRSLAGPAARNVMSRKTVMPARSSVEKHRLHVVLHLHGVIERESAPRASV